jgi:signal transduction histidine kinase
MPAPRDPQLGRDDDIEHGFDVDEPTPVIAAGTRDDMADKARAAVAAAAAPPERDDVAALAHDLKNPLTIIMLEASQIEQRLGANITPAMLASLDRIAQNAAYIDRIVSDLLDASSAEAGKLDLRIDRIDLARILRAAVDRAVPPAERRRVKVDIREPLYVEGDEVRIERVIANLLSNALKYSDANTPIALRLERRAGTARVSVIDHGEGMTLDETRRVFERYRRATTGTQQGYGLGLYTCRCIIEAHRGTIAVSSTPGRGSRFYFELPLPE